MKKSAKQKTTAKKTKKSAVIRRTGSPLPSKIKSLNLLHVLQDQFGSASVLTEMLASEYLELVEDAFAKRGSLDGQRDTLKTTSAIRIRDRMAKDFERGAILPPVVVGVLLDQKTSMDEVTTWSSDQMRGVLERVASSHLSIIDGMQRTTVLNEISSADSDRRIRVEFWLSHATANLTYRMLVLNTGQVPWNLRRQIEVINRSFIEELRTAFTAETVPASIYEIDDHSRRVNAAEYQANDVVEMWLAFGLRKATVDKETVLADQFSRLDMIEAVGQASFFPTFVSVFGLLVAFDKAISRLPQKASKKQQRFDGGRSLFDSQPACVGFMAAAAQKVYGRPGANRDPDQSKKHLRDLKKRLSGIISRLEKCSVSNLEAFLDFATLNEVIQTPTTKIGDFDRSLFTDAFRVLFDEDVNSMTPCWRSQ